MESNYSEMDVSCSLQHFPVLSSVSLTLYVRAPRLRSRGGGRGGEGDVLHRSEWVMMVGSAPDPDCNLTAPYSHGGLNWRCYIPSR